MHSRLHISKQTAEHLFLSDHHELQECLLAWGCLPQAPVSAEAGSTFKLAETLCHTIRDTTCSNERAFEKLLNKLKLEQHRTSRMTANMVPTNMAGLSFHVSTSVQALLPAKHSGCAGHHFCRCNACVIQKSDDSASCFCITLVPVHDGI